MLPILPFSKSIVESRTLLIDVSVGASFAIKAQRLASDMRDALRLVLDFPTAGFNSAKGYPIAEGVRAEIT